MRHISLKVIGTVAVILLVSSACLPKSAASSAPQKSNRTSLKPGSFILFSPKDDVELGKQASQDVEKDLSMLRNTRVDTYVDTLGKRLAAMAPGEKYPYQFKVVNDKAINAFALPGGYIYVNRGIFESADTEAQLAGVMAHEIGHVALRHSASQLSKAALTQLGVQLLGGVGGNVGGMLGKLGMGGMDLLLLKNSREAENQADLMGTQILYDSGYDPNAMAEFFEKLNAEDKSKSPQFLSDHPNPDNRVGSVRKEISKLGGAPSNARRDSEEFHQIRNLVATLPDAAPKSRTSTGPKPGNTAVATPDRPSTRYIQASVGDLTLQHPDNWRGTTNSGAVTIAPDRGIVQGALMYGMIVSTFRPTVTRGRQMTLAEATDQLVAQLQRVNPQMRVGGRRTQTRIAGQAALSVELTNQLPSGEKETDVLVTTLRSNGTVDYFVAVAPQKDF
ncbi:MAG TPA: M48 family metallopeptidase, partial [Terriglobia bacterium]|nr:M48 family metallopeptidase [Terriglobia bacterium]